METDPFRLRVLKRLTEVLCDIRPATGYRHDLSSGVFRGIFQFGDADEHRVPLVSILEDAKAGDLAATHDNDGCVTSTWVLLLQGWVEDVIEHPTDPAHLLMAEVKLALVKEKTRRQNDMVDILGLGIGSRSGSGNVITDMTIGTGIVRPAEENFSSKANFWLTLTLDLVEDPGNPYS